MPRPKATATVDPETNSSSRIVTTGDDALRTMHIKCTLIRPLLLHSPKLIDPTEPLAIEIKELMKKRKKLGTKQDTSSIEAEILKLQYIGTAYWDEEARKFYVPTDNLEACIKVGAQKSRLGKQTEAGITVTSESGVIHMEGFQHANSLEKIYDDEVRKPNGLVFKRPVRVPPRTGSRVMCHRAQIPSRAYFEADVIFDNSIISETDIKKACVDAGRYAGLGVWRPKFGTFIVEFCSVRKGIIA